jgi:hypothetical protein
MITKNEITSLSLSPTKKDFAQIWNELLEVAGKLSERWDPTSTNESDPGIVILKALTGIADKLNYNIDKNTLEAFMPTAAQEDSMRKLCDMLGYNIKYYQSAITDVTIKYYNSEPSEEESNVMTTTGVYIPKFTVITNNDQDISYFTINEKDLLISADSPICNVKCMEGQIVKCESLSDNNVITSNHISEDNRFYLPETQIAENGIFVYNIFSYNGTDLSDGTPWTKVDNLNTQSRGSRVFKFGFDSYSTRPYIEFPEDFSELFNDGIFIYYARTSGVNGNVSPRTLTQFEVPNYDGWENISAESFSAENVFAATSGANIETIRQAYSNFKKTIGTFETLVTCRDYMNKIYSMTNDYGKPLVSNILVTDIRNDLNRAITICSCDDAGIFYKETALCREGISEIDHFDLIFYPFKSYNQIRNLAADIQETYDSSFTYAYKDFKEVRDRIEASNLKTLAHNIKTARAGDLVSINNYLRLNATIATNSKITEEEGKFIKEKIKIALANAFNMRELDFGEEIPFDGIVNVIENADSRIRIASLNDPLLYTTFTELESIDDGAPILKEYAVASNKWLTEEDAKATGRLDLAKDENQNYIGTFNSDKAKRIYNDLAVRNILAGRVALFDYNKTFKAAFSEGAYQITREIPEPPRSLTIPDETNPFTICTYEDKIYTGEYIDKDKSKYKETSVPERYVDNIITNINSDIITEIAAQCEIPTDDFGNITDITLSDGEFIKFKAPNFTTIKTYPAYVNYHLKLRTDGDVAAEYAEANSLFNILDGRNAKGESSDIGNKWEDMFSYFRSVNNGEYIKTFTLKQKISKYSNPTEEDLANKDGLMIEVDNKPVAPEETVEEFLAKSGCVKLVNTKDTDGYVATLAWDGSDGDEIPSKDISSVVPTIRLSSKKFESPFITALNVIAEIKDAIDTVLVNNRAILPSECAWTISFSFECVPFESNSLDEWNKFIKSTIADGKSSLTQAKIVSTEVSDSAVHKYFWRSYGEGHQKGKYILDNSNNEKLLPFDHSYFGLLPEARLRSIYLAEKLGNDASPTVIKNGTEYELKTEEALYIEYTPSTTTEEGTTQKGASVTEIYGPGTIIRPGGFETGLQSSTALIGLGTPYKTVTFINDGKAETLDMQRFGANEQVEIRDFAKIHLTKDSFASSKDVNYIWVYKNFNGCEELEKRNPSLGPRENNIYTLKDGEYIFYTDKNKTELAYYGSGTQVTLEGTVELPVCEIIDSDTLFNLNIQEIPWQAVQLKESDQGKDEIIFQEYQYITIGPQDTLKKITVLNAESEQKKLTKEWHFCENVEYVVAGSDEVSTLPLIDLLKSSSNSSEGDGWQVCSMLELDVSPNIPQTLRNTAKIQTSIVLRSTDAAGSVKQVSDPITPENIDDPPISFKTNITCQACGDKININDVYYKPGNIEGFELKVFTIDKNVLVKTEPSKVIPYRGDGITDITNWPGTTLGIQKERTDIWSSVAFDKIKATVDTTVINYDNALRLTLSVLPNTYGVFCIYVNYTGDVGAAKTWIEVLPGTLDKDIMLLNDKNPVKDYLDEARTKISRLYLNPGINCIRVNKSGRIFIKTSNESQGSLLFDELQLVNYRQIKDDSSRLIGYTQGLNLSQLDYQYTSDIKVETEESKKIYQASCIDNSINSLDKLYAEDGLKLHDCYNNLIEAKSKVQFLVETEEAIAADLQKLEDYDSEALSNLLEIHSQVSNSLEQKENLLDALENNKDMESLQQELSALFNDLSSIEKHQQQLLQDFADFNEKVTTDLQNISKESITETFDKAISDAYYNQSGQSEEENNLFLSNLYGDVKSCVYHLIEDNYNAELVTLLTELEQITSSEELAGLSSILNDLKAKNTLTSRSQLTHLLNHLNKLLRPEVGIDTYIKTLVDAVENATDVDNQEAKIKDALKSLRTFLNYDELNFIIDEIERVLSESDNGQLIEFISKLESVKSSTADLLTKLDGIINSYTSNSDEFKSSIDDLIAEITSHYDSKVNTILESIKGLKFGESIADKLLPKLEKSTNLQIQIITNKLTQVLTKVEDNRDKLLNFYNITDVLVKNQSELPEFLTEGIINVWPKYLKQIIDYKINLIKESLNDWIYSSGTKESLLSQISKSSEDYYINAVVEDISTTSRLLIDKINSLDDTLQQNTARVSIINSISQHFPTSTLMNDAMNAFKPDDNAELSDVEKRNLIIINILEELTIEGKTLFEKQQLLVELGNELQEAKKLDTNLLTIINKILYPNIVKFVNSPESKDTFYSKLAEEVGELMEEVSEEKLELLTTSLCVDFDKQCYESIKNANTVADLSVNLKGYTEGASLLSDNYLAYFNKFRDSNESLENISNVQEHLEEIKSKQLAVEDTCSEIRKIIQDSSHSELLIEILESLLQDLDDLSKKEQVSTEAEDIYRVLKLENLLLADIMAIDNNRDFYYNAPIEASLAIDFNENTSNFNTLMNPMAYYDINNINNNFVISKLDINYLADGIQIARSSRLS